MLTEKERGIIESVFYRLVAVRSDTNTYYEPIIEDVILNWFRQRDYFLENPRYVGTEPLREDPNKREVVWSLVKGAGKETIVLINHHDAVGVEEYGKLQDLAFRPMDLKAALKKSGKEKRGAEGSRFRGLDLRSGNGRYESGSRFTDGSNGTLQS